MQIISRKILNTISGPNKIIPSLTKSTNVIAKPNPEAINETIQFAMLVLAGLLCLKDLLIEIVANSNKIVEIRIVNPLIKTNAIPPHGPPR